MLKFNHIEELIGEATEYDKKQAVELKKPKSWCKSVSAFANTSGGTLIFGIANDDSIVGLPDADFDDRLEIYSPGGMPDGTFIQDRNIKGVPSVRRNPVLADIFARLGYMERSGSGLSKMREAYEFSANYSKDKEPVFYSDRSQFLVTLPNLNYLAEIPADRPADRSADPADKHQLNARQKEVLSKMEYGVEYSAAELAEILGIKGSRTRELLNDLVDKGLLNKTAETNRRRYLKVPLDR